MPRYLDPKNDLMFKKVFGEHKHLCISLLNSLLKFEGDTEDVPPDLLKTKELSEAVEYVLESSLTEEERDAYDRIRDAQRAGRTLINAAKDEGFGEGITQGILQTAKTMKSKNMDIKTIAEITGLSEKDIIKL